jgi:arylformamidase
MLSAEFVEREYNNRAAVPDHGRWFERWAADSEAARGRLQCRLGLRYGSGPKETLDLFPAENPRGVFLFLHGGYWRSLDKNDFSFIAPLLVEQGIGVAVVNYDLCPDVSIAHIVDECRRAVAWLQREGQQHGMPNKRLVIGGHSAGGHLAAMLFATDWNALGFKGDLICGGVSISGVFDLEPLIQFSGNVDLKLDSSKAHRLSPIHMQPRTKARLLLAAGRDETSEFSRQSWLLWERWPECHPPGAHGPLFVADRHHFSIVDDLADPESSLLEQTLGLF